MDLINLLQKQIAEIFRVSRKTIQRWTAEGMPRNQDGTFSAPDCVSWFAERLEAKDRSDKPEPGEKWLEAYRRERFKIARLDRRVRQGKLIVRDEVFQAWAERVRLVTAGLEAFADRLPALLVEKDRATIYRVLKEEVRELRQRFAADGKYTPPPFDIEAFATAIREVVERFNAKGGPGGDGS